jgi:hypothetical protein
MHRATRASFAGSPGRLALSAAEPPGKRIRNVIPGLGQCVGSIMRLTLGRWTRRARAYRELEQVRADINGCAAIFASIRGGTIQPILLPVASALYLSALHADGFLTIEGLHVIQEFLAPAEQANFLLAAPQHGPPGLQGAQRLTCLMRGKLSRKLATQVV